MVLGKVKLSIPIGLHGGKPRKSSFIWRGTIASRVLSMVDGGQLRRTTTSVNTNLRQLRSELVP